MRTLLITAVAAVAVAIPGASFAAGSPRWVTYPSCTAATTKYENGRPFSIHYDAPYSPPTMNAGAQCLSGLWARPDLNYYNVDVKVGWGWGATPVTALDAPIGTVSAGGGGEEGRGGGHPWRPP